MINATNKMYKRLINSKVKCEYEAKREVKCEVII